MERGNLGGSYGRPYALLGHDSPRSCTVDDSERIVVGSCKPIRASQVTLDISEPKPFLARPYCIWYQTSCDKSCTLEGLRIRLEALVV